MHSFSKNNFPDDNFLKYCKALQTKDQNYVISILPKILKDYPRCPFFYYKLSEHHYYQKELRKSLETIIYALDLYSDNIRTNHSYYNKSIGRDLKIDLLFLRVRVLNKLSAPIEEISQALMDLKEESEQNQENIEEINDIILKYSDKYKLNLIKKPSIKPKRSFERLEEVAPEAKEVFELMEASNSQNFLKEEGFPVNIISKSWFVKWEKFTNFHYLSGERIEEPHSIKELIQEEKTLNENPGPINQEDILSREKILTDPDKIKNYCNVVLLLGLEENRDFLIVSHKVWKYLFKIYGGQEIKRFIVSVNDDSNLTHVELNLKKVLVNFIILIIKE